MTQKNYQYKINQFFSPQINTENTDNCESGKKLVTNVLFPNIYILHFAAFSLQNIVVLSGLKPTQDGSFGVAHG